MARKMQMRKLRTKENQLREAETKLKEANALLLLAQHQKLEAANCELRERFDQHIKVHQPNSEVNDVVREEMMKLKVSTGDRDRKLGTRGNGCNLPCAGSGKEYYGGEDAAPSPWGLKS